MQIIKLIRTDDGDCDFEMLENVIKITGHFDLNKERKSIIISNFEFTGILKALNNHFGISYNANV